MENDTVLRSKNSSDETKSDTWNNWAVHLLSETKRFNEEITKLQNELKEHNKDLSNFQKELIKIELSENGKKIEQDIHQLIERVIKLENNVDELKTFKTKATTIMAVISAIFSTSLTVIGIVIAVL